MSEKKKASVGDLVDVKEGAEVTRPDGSVSKVTGGSYVLDEPGTFVVDGEEVTAK